LKNDPKFDQICEILRAAMWFCLPIQYYFDIYVDMVNDSLYSLLESSGSAKMFGWLIWWVKILLTIFKNK
jgi:hypothetical protein